MYIGHAGTRDGRGHFRVRAVYAALGDMMQADIRVLSIQALDAP